VNADRPALETPPPAFAIRMASIYAVSFAFTGIYLPYFPLWLNDRGLDAEQIGLVLSLPIALRVLTSGQITAYADRLPDRAWMVIALFAGAAVAVAMFPLAHGFWPILAVTLAVSLFTSPLQPVADSIALAGVRRFGADYGRIRAWGSVAFILANLAVGWLIARSGTESIVLTLIGVALVGALLSPVTPRLGRPRKPASALEIAEASVLRLLGKRRFMLVTVGCWLTQGTHSFYYAFGSIHWRELGYSGEAIGAFWAVGVAAEVALFSVSRRVFGRVSPVSLAMVGAAAALARWLAMPFDLGHGGYLLLQALHGLSFGATHLGLLQFIAASVPEERTGSAQAIGFVLGAVFMGAGIWASGALYAAAGPYGYWIMGGFAIAAAGMLALAARLRPDRFAA